MDKIFGLDSPLIRFLNRVADLLWLNILTLICCIPVITIGASLTAAHYVALRMCRNEEGYISKDFFKSFKMNFKQSTLIWLIIMLVGAVIGFDLYIMDKVDLGLPEFFQVIIMAAGFLVLFMAVWVFPVQAKFVNTISQTMKNAFSLSLIQILKTLIMIILYVAIPLLSIFFVQLFPLLFVLGLSFPVYVSALLYNKMFQKLEDKIMERMANEEQEAESTDEAWETVAEQNPQVDEETDTEE